MSVCMAELRNYLQILYIYFTIPKNCLYVWLNYAIIYKSYTYTLQYLKIAYKSQILSLKLIIE